MEAEEAEKIVNPPLYPVGASKQIWKRKVLDVVTDYWLPLLYLVVWVLCFIHLCQIIQE